MKKEVPKLWYSRGYLPHFDGGEIVQFITFRLADSLPKRVLEKWQKELETELISEIEYYRKIDKYLDNSYGKCWLKDKRIAEMVEDTLFYFDNAKYKLIAYVLMPNHVHILIKPLDDYSLASIMHSIKSYTAHQANPVLERKGIFWSKEYFDRYIRDYEHFIKTVDYIHNNPVKAKLCKNYDQWRYSSAYKGKR
jgi:putative DNA methylase